MADKVTTGTTGHQRRRARQSVLAARCRHVRAAARLAGADFRPALRAAQAFRPAARRRGDRGAARAHPARPREGGEAQGGDGAGARHLRAGAWPRPAPRPTPSPRTMRDKLAAEVDKERAAVDAQIARKLADAEARIAQSKAKAMASVGDIAADTASAVVAKLLGQGSQPRTRCSGRSCSAPRSRGHGCDAADGRVLGGRLLRRASCSSLSTTRCRR